MPEKPYISQQEDSHLHVEQTLVYNRILVDIDEHNQEVEHHTLVLFLLLPPGN
jgi:hypothetical protein